MPLELTLDRTNRVSPLEHALDVEARRLAGAVPPVFEMSEAGIVECAAAYARGGQPSVDLVEAFRSKNDPRSYTLFRIALVLRTDYGAAPAEAFVRNFMGMPDLAERVSRELMHILNLDGRLDEALRHYMDIQAAGNTNAQDHLTAAWMYLRRNDVETASRLLLLTHGAYPERRAECAASAQFFEFYQQFGKTWAEATLDSISEIFRKPDLNDIENDIRTALRDKRPYLLLRLGDGEGAYTRIGHQDEMRYIDLYRANRKQFLAIWFGDEALIDDMMLDKVMSEYSNAIVHADCIGGLYRTAIEHEYRVGSRRGIAWVVNTMRTVLRLGLENPAWAATTPVCELVVHYQLLLSGALGRLLQDREHLGLISCHAGLPAALEKKFRIRHVEFFKVPGEKKHARELGEAAVEGLHWPDRYHELIDELARPVDRRGQLFLVAAGILGKIYAARLKAAGAVVLDIGAVADLWMNKRTRTFPDLPKELRL